MRLLLALRAKWLARQADHDLARSYLCARWSWDAMDRADAKLAEAGTLLERIRALRAQA